MFVMRDNLLASSYLTKAGTVSIRENVGLKEAKEGVAEIDDADPMVSLGLCGSSGLPVSSRVLKD